MRMQQPAGKAMEKKQKKVQQPVAKEMQTWI